MNIVQYTSDQTNALCRESSPHCSSSAVSNITSARIAAGRDDSTEASNETFVPFFKSTALGDESDDTFVFDDAQFALLDFNEEVGPDLPGCVLTGSVVQELPFFEDMHEAIWAHTQTAPDHPSAKGSRLCETSPSFSPLGFDAALLHCVQPGSKGAQSQITLSHTSQQTSSSPDTGRKRDNCGLSAAPMAHCHQGELVMAHMMQHYSLMLHQMNQMIATHQGGGISPTVQVKPIPVAMARRLERMDAGELGVTRQKDAASDDSVNLIKRRRCA